MSIILSKDSRILVLSTTQIYSIYCHQGKKKLEHIQIIKMLSYIDHRFERMKHDDETCSNRVMRGWDCVAGSAVTVEIVTGNKRKKK